MSVGYLTYAEVFVNIYFGGKCGCVSLSKTTASLRRNLSPQRCVQMVRIKPKPGWEICECPDGEVMLKEVM